jgi:flagellar M-ring protein FliF
MFQRLLETLRSMSPARLATLGLVVFGVIGAISFLVNKGAKPEMGLLFSNLDATDSAKIVNKLQEKNIKFETSTDTAEIFISKEDIARVRMEMAQEGLPAGGNVGFEIFDKSDFTGLSSSLLDINYLRALEGELARSISTIQGIMSCRIHLVTPKKEMFSREIQTSSASVMVRLKPSCVLSATQIQSVQYLVSSAVPGLSQERVSIVDDKGALLARGGYTDSLNSGQFNMHQDLQLQLENRIARSIETLLERITGTGKVRAQVSAILDFDQQSSTDIVYNPEGQVVRSSSVTDEQSKNQEKTSQDSVSVETSLPSKGEEDKSSPGGSSNNTTNNIESITYEISNSTKQFTKEIGTIKRLSVAVIVDGKNETKDGQKPKYVALSDDEVEKMTTLVKTSIGFQEQRGDEVQVLNMPFAPMEEIDSSIVPSNLWSKISVQKIIELLIIAALILTCLFLVVRPIVTQLLNDPASQLKPKILRSPGKNNFVTSSIDGQVAPNGSEDFSMNDSSINTPISRDNLPAVMTDAILATQKSSSDDPIDFLLEQSPIRKIGKIIERYPQESVAVLRSWIYSRA